ncbi:hypothetical protein, partial [Coxiella-like endosymbiont of Rhipicephalus sanguineus]|uniref:hypothetical protein n=1 Tax=Coxiella-like endosymbiont of Rhipicephalus sanguineus TaxID=1955402 RepID=UPI0020422E49
SRVINFDNLLKISNAIAAETTLPTLIAKFLTASHPSYPRRSPRLPSSRTFHLIHPRRIRLGRAQSLNPKHPTPQKRNRFLP